MTDAENAFRWDADAHALEDAEGYQRDFVPPMFRPSAEGLLERVPPRPGSRVLDAGCGTGVLALLALEQVGPEGSVAALDVNAAQLRVASSLPGAEAVEWRQGDIAQLPYEDCAFDVVYCHHVLQFVPDRVGVLREVRRVLAPGGTAAAAAWGPLDRHPGFAAVVEAYLARGDRETAAMMRSPRALDELDSLVALLTGAGYEQVAGETFEVDVRFPSAATFVDGLVPPDDGAVREQALATLAPLDGAGGFALTDVVHVAVGRA